MPKSAHDKLPPAIAEFLADTKGLRGRRKRVMERLACAPCAINAFSRIIARLQKHDSYNACILLGVIPEYLIADAAVLAAAVDHHATRTAYDELPEKIDKAARLANDLRNLLEDIDQTRLDAGLDSECINALGAAIPETISSCDNVVELAYAASSEDFRLILPEQDWAVTMRKWNDVAAFVAFADDRIEGEAKMGRLPYRFRLTDPEMAGLAWAAIGRDDLSPVINRGEEKDKRAETVRKIRTARTSKTSALRIED